jgi:hypothetical protein
MIVSKRDKRGIPPSFINGYVVEAQPEPPTLVELAFLLASRAAIASGEYRSLALFKPRL